MDLPIPSNLIWALHYFFKTIDAILFIYSDLRMYRLLGFLIGATLAFTPYQTSIIRTQQVAHKAPLRSGIVDAVLAQDYAFTDQVKTLTHIDAIRFECCPNTFTNVITHEIHHQNGRQHTAGVKDDPMSYVLTIQTSGEIVEGNFVLPSLRADQPWATQILNRGSSATAPNGAPAGIESQVRRLPTQIISDRLPNSTAGFGRTP
jgi:hypothetical protein